MRRFRPPSSLLGAADDLDRVMDVIDALWLPAHFFVAPELRLSWEFVPRDEVPWELHQEHLLQTRECQALRVMAGWNIHQISAGRRSDEPLLALKLDPAERAVHVVRGILTRAWEPDDHGTGLEGREAERWRREKVGSVILADYADLEELRDEVTCLLWQAVVGTSRLPLTSLEAPLPAFSLGHLHYLRRDDLPIDKGSPEAIRPLRHGGELPASVAGAAMGHGERAKALEFHLRCVAPGEVPEAARAWLAQTGAVDALRLLRRMFNDVSLSPYTGFVGNALRFLEALTSLGAVSGAEQREFLAHLLRQNHRHLQAYDLVTFHHRGANYPDALLLDEVLTRLATVCRAQVAPAQALAFTLGCLIAHRYRDHAVPDAPTSPGENVRVFPGLERVPAEQIEQPHVRHRLLFSGWGVRSRLGEHALSLVRSAVSLLDDPAHLLELGKAVFIDRPFGIGKPPVAPDQTLLLAHELFSLALANAQTARWRRLLEEEGIVLTEDEQRLLRRRAPDDVPVCGLPVRDVARPSRPVPSLADAQRVASDFLVLRTLPGSVRAFRACFADSLGTLGNAEWWSGRVTIARLQDGAGITVLDAELRPRLRMEIDASRGYRHRAGLETPIAGLRRLSQGDDFG